MATRLGASRGRRGTAPRLPELAEVLAAQWTAVAEVVDGQPDDAFGAAAGTLPGWTIGAITMRATRSVHGLTEVLALPGGPGDDGGGGRPVSALDRLRHLSGAGVWAVEPGVDVEGELPIGAGRPGVVREQFTAEVATARRALARLAEPSANAAQLGEFLRAAVVEAVLHGLDLGVEPARPALRVATRLVADLFAVQVPGHAVELRVPPFAAVQIVAGPRHTRGTPPNVVEAGPVPFLLVCTGRVRFATAVADGRITASGERSDLTAQLPLL
ncbi:sterol carrier family protein [Frankia sp. R82]|uniref:sterol carrier family protein n=1 Tax=Frankia sp. R82 TaxID=2950553 RepID=UPI002044C763|nr:sterol carrier family protein [Frankia sp. R82]MCM3887075.1 sterol carrier family protein [Frankia sp. R82]